MLFLDKTDEKLQVTFSVLVPKLYYGTFKLHPKSSANASLLSCLCASHAQIFTACKVVVKD